MSQANEASEYLLNRYGRSVNAVFASSVTGTSSMLNALRNFNLAGQVFLVGYDASDASLDAIKTGEIQGLVITNLYRMGYLGVSTPVDYIKGGNMPTMVDVGVTLFTMANIESTEVQEVLGRNKMEAVG